MIEFLSVILRLAGTGLILLAILHIPIARKLQWREDWKKISPVNASIFKVHAFFICLLEVLMGLPCLLDPGVFLTPSRAGLWACCSLTVFWAARLYCQFFVYRPALWRGRKLETVLHGVFTLIWVSLIATFATCAAIQGGLLQP